jgi:hypothetical protein
MDCSGPVHRCACRDFDFIADCGEPRPMSEHAQGKRAEPRRRPRRAGVAALAIIASALLAVLAWPRLQAAVLYLPVDAAIDRYFETRELPVAQLDALAARAREAIDAHPHHRYLDGLSLLHYLQALDVSRPPGSRSEALHAAIGAAEGALRLAPAQPSTWLRVAHARSALREGREQVLPPLELSILSGRVDPVLVLPRLELGLRYLDGMTPEARSLLRDQAVLAWRLNDRALVQSVREGRVKVGALRTLLGPVGADVLAELEGRL